MQRCEPLVVVFVCLFATSLFADEGQVPILMQSEVREQPNYLVELSTILNVPKYYIFFQSNTERIMFLYDGHETFLSAIVQIGLHPDWSPNMLILRSAEVGKPAEVIAVNYDAAFQDAKKDVVLQPGDTILIRPKFTNELDKQHQKPRIARAVFFDAEMFTAVQLAPTGDVHSLEKGTLAPLVRQLKDEVSISVLLCGKTGEDGFWLILYGNEDAVEELYAVFSAIASGP